MKKTLIIAFVSLIIGGVAGYLIGGSSSATMGTKSEGKSAMHGAGNDSMVTELSKLSGNDRDQAYLESMIIHHQSAVEMSRILLETTQRPELKQLAENVIAAQTAEIDQMKGWLSQWYGR